MFNKIIVFLTVFLMVGGCSKETAKTFTQISGNNDVIAFGTDLFPYVPSFNRAFDESQKVIMVSNPTKLGCIIVLESAENFISKIDGGWLVINNKNMPSDNEVAKLVTDFYQEDHVTCKTS